MDRLIPLRQAKPYTGFARSRLYDFIASGQLTAIKVGGRVFLAESEIKRFVESNATRLEPRSKKEG